MLLQTSDVKIKKISQTGSTGVFEYSPLPVGFGRTLGNTLRRVLLTSLEGGAVTEVRLPKVSHQFTTIPGVKEDIVEISLNLKLVRARVHSNNPIIGKISKKGKGPVTAGDIVVTSEVEIANKDLVIANLSDSNSELEMDLTFEKGVGYVPTEDRKSSKVGVILIDALYSPVLNVSYEVSATRQDDITGLDKLVINVTTDGTISPEDALTSSSTILRNFFSRFAKGPDPEEQEVIEETSDEDILSQKEDIFLEDLHLPTRTINALKKHGVETLRQLSNLNDEELSDVKNLGEKSIKEIKKILKKEGYRE